MLPRIWIVLRNFGHFKRTLACCSTVPNSVLHLDVAFLSQKQNPVEDIFPTSQPGIFHTRRDLGRFQHTFPGRSLWTRRSLILFPQRNSTSTALASLT